MRWLRSFRLRLLIGSVLWTMGLLALAHMMSIAVMRHYPHVLRIRHEHVVLFGIALAIAGFLQVRTGLTPFHRLRKHLSDVRAGRQHRVEGEYPAEVQPLVDELNGLIDDRDRRIGEALAKAGDLAHGLKTPLAVLAQEADRLDAAGQHETAENVRQQTDRMLRQVEYHLVHARASAASRASETSSVRESIEGIVRTLQRLHDGRIRIDTNASDAVVRVRKQDLDEILGNLLDNACKWAKSNVIVTTTAMDDRLAITVDDDGPGIDPAMRERVLQRGVRADEAAPGSGLGLAIVRELVALYEGSIAIGESPSGGCRVRVELGSTHPGPPL